MRWFGKVFCTSYPAARRLAEVEADVRGLYNQNFEVKSNSCMDPDIFSFKAGSLERVYVYICCITKEILQVVIYVALYCF